MTGAVIGRATSESSISLSIELDPASVRKWFVLPNSSSGILITIDPGYASSAATQFMMSESVESNKRPLLTVYYSIE